MEHQHHRQDYQPPDPDQIYPQHLATLPDLRAAQNNCFHLSCLQALKRELLRAALDGRNDLAVGLRRALDLFASEEATVLERESDDEPSTTP